MKRKQFLRKSLLGAAGLTLGAKAANSKATEPSSTYDKLMAPVGFNHLPNQEIKTMKTILHKADTRGHANHGWLNSHHTFSFANYYNPERVHFGVLRVLNDDTVAPGRGFGRHPHDNMEIISIPLAGALEHKDSMDNAAVIRQGDVQVMSAGTGVFHSEYNKSGEEEVRFLQIWMFPREKGVEPRYDQITLSNNDTKNQLQQVLSPSKDDAGVWVHQDAWFHLGDLEKGWSGTYNIKHSGNGVYAFLIEGEVEVAGQQLGKRDGFGIWDTEAFEIKATADAKLLLMDVPMEV